MPRLALLALAALPVACGTPEPPANPFAGAWTTAERQQIAFRDNTVVVQPPNAAPTAMGKESCDGAFRFGYGQKSREALLGLTPRQPDLKNRLSKLLVRADYPVAELACGEGASTYVLLGDRDRVVMHCDQDLAAGVGE
jgi:hypothetical protein